MRYTKRNLMAGLVVGCLVGACASSASRVPPAASQVLFVCEHGNVKSLMAASYFNRITSERSLPFHALSRGTAPDSTTVPPTIAARLLDEGFDVTDFRPSAVTSAEVSMSRRVILISTAPPEDPQFSGATVERWTDVPPASTDYAAASAALKRHIEELVDELSRAEAR